jgi:hypothetical protein
MNRNSHRWTIVIAALIIAGFFTALAHSPAASADEPALQSNAGPIIGQTIDDVADSIDAAIATVEAARWTQPYGGCKEAVMYADSTAADECRAHGWIIRPRFAINPHGVLKASALPHCEFEDGTPGRRICLWDASVDGIGNGGGSFIMVGPYDGKHRVGYLWMDDPRRVGDSWVGARLDKVLDREHGEQRWQHCVTRGERLVVRCPNGLRQHI